MKKKTTTKKQNKTKKTEKKRNKNIKKEKILPHNGISMPNHI